MFATNRDAVGGHRGPRVGSSGRVEVALVNHFRFTRVPAYFRLDCSVVGSNCASCSLGDYCFVRECVISTERTTDSARCGRDKSSYGSATRNARRRDAKRRDASPSSAELRHPSDAPSA